MKYFASDLTRRLACVLALTAISVVALADHNSEASLEQRTARVGTINIMTEEEAAAAKEEADKLAAAAAADSGPVDGAAVYNSSCLACHDGGIAGAPKTGDAAAWGSRMDQGIDTLIDHAVNGFQGETGVMPARGGNTTLSDEQVAAAVQHMVDAIQ